MSRPFARSGAAALGLVADRLLGEPPANLHPLRGFGWLMAAAERAWWADDRLAGTVHAAAGSALGAAAGSALAAVPRGLQWAARPRGALATPVLPTSGALAPAPTSRPRRSTAGLPGGWPGGWPAAAPPAGAAPGWSGLGRGAPPAGTAPGWSGLGRGAPPAGAAPGWSGPGRGAPVAAATWLAVGGRALWEAASGVGAALEAGDLGAARALLPALVGRDPNGLDETELARAVVESVAENTVDAIVAPALWAAAAGAPGVLAYRAVNTLDAMVGHRDARYERFGWASARLDDALNWAPARATAALVVVVRPRAAAAVLAAVRSQAPAHPSPNSGVAEAAFAAALGVRLGGVNRYGDRTEQRPSLGTGRPPGPPDIGRAVRLSSDVAWALTGALGGWYAFGPGLSGRRPPARGTG